MKKLGLAITAIAVLIFVAGCACHKAKVEKTSYKATHHTYHGKLGTLSTNHDNMK